LDSEKVSWLSEETIMKIRGRRNLKHKHSQASTRAQKQLKQQEYNKKNDEVKTVARKDKREVINKLTTAAEEAQVKNHTAALGPKNKHQ
jgi:hypothetical protein